ncbi:MAG: GGDEF domain-containing protein [Desulfovibrio sp.]|nr:GGDEF domain-containing protein [Desulfovibrio sp.]
MKDEMHPFAVVLFDVNDLKHINDTLCHEAGDAYIISACKNIYAIFKKSPVYRIERIFASAAESGAGTEQ